MEREPNTIYVLSLSYGKDSIAAIEACKQLGYPLDAIVHAEIWFNDEISADLPPMLEFKKYADKVIKERYGIDVIHTCAMRKSDGGGYVTDTYCRQFYTVRMRGKYVGAFAGFPLARKRNSTCIKLKTRAISKTNICRYVLQALREQQEQTIPGGVYGFPRRQFPVCQDRLKASVLDKYYRHLRIPSEGGELVYETQTSVFSNKRLAQGAKINIVQYLGIAADESERIKRHTVQGKILPLVDIGWDEEYCRKWCEENNLLSPIYTTSLRGGCWFCHNQSVNQLRLLRKNYPELWKHLLKLDKDSPVTFHADGHTVMDFEKRFAAEDDGRIPKDKPFRWKMVEGGDNGSD